MRFNLYDFMKLPAFTSDQRQIRAAYRKELKYCHPDSGNLDPELAREHTRILIEIYRILSDPEKKAEYDRYLEATANDPI